jgi:hypothetical protein
MTQHTANWFPFLFVHCSARTSIVPNFFFGWQNHNGHRSGRCNGRNQNHCKNPIEIHLIFTFIYQKIDRPGAIKIVTGQKMLVT